MIILRNKRYTENNNNSAEESVVSPVQKIDPQQDARDFNTEATNLLQQVK